MPYQQPAQKPIMAAPTPTPSGWKDHVDTRAPAPAPPKPDDDSELDKWRKTLSASFKKAANFVSAVSSPVPDETGDGSKLSPEDKNALYKRIEGDLKDLPCLDIADVKTLIEIQAKKLSGEPIDDKTYLMEGLIRTAAKLPDDSRNRETLTNQFLTQLWGDLQHPPLSYLGAKYQYRQPDGSLNSLVHPQLGAAGTPYARTVKPVTMQTPALPDAGVVFDSVMTRKEKNKEKHPNQISSVLFYLASIIIHDCFRTDHVDYSTSLTSSYLDLAPLYGSNWEEQKQMRTFADGKLKPDCFSEQRLLFFPPGVGVLLVMFNRFHNYVVGNLAAINEGARFTKPSPLSKEQEADKDVKDKWDDKMKKYDEDLFQTGRLITCGLYVNIILVDYVRTILNLNTTDSNWALNPRADIKGVPMGVGNQVSAEFNLVYRWHSTISDRDEKWTWEMWEHLFGKKVDPKTVSGHDFVRKVMEVARKTSLDPLERPFAGIKRNADGTLPDQPLVDVIVESVDDCANSFGPNRVPAVMRAIEILGIEQSRSWNLGSLNEFRKYFGLEPHRTFEDITSDTYVADQLKHLYDHPDKVEIYPGLVVEDAKMALSPGSGLTPSYTVSRAVLSDAVALVRGDRFYTLDYNPRTLTNWGFNLVSSDTSVNNGCVFYKLFLRAFPQHFSYNSIYAHYPLTVPTAMKANLLRLSRDTHYDFSKPVYTARPHLVKEYKIAAQVLNDQQLWKVTWGKAMEYLMGPPAKDFMLAGDGPKNKISRSMMYKALYADNWTKEVRTYYANKTKELLQEKSAKIASFNQVDLIRDVGNLAHVHFCAELFMLPLKTDERPRGVFTEAELYLIMSSVFTLVFFDADPANSFPLHQKSRQATQMLGKIVQANVEAIGSSGLVSRLIAKIWGSGEDAQSGLKSYGIHMIKRLLDTGMDPEQLVWGHILGTAGGMVGNQGQMFAQVIEYFLLGDGTQYWADVQGTAKLDTEEAFETLGRYVMEASRLNGETAVLRESASDTSLPSPSGTGPSVAVKKGDHIFVHLRAASHDPAIFPDPDTLKLDRPMDAYIHLGMGAHQCLGLQMTKVAITAMLKEVAKLENLRPAAGMQGKMHKVEAMPGMGKYGYHKYLTEMWDGYWGFPCGKLNFLRYAMENVNEG